MISNQISRFGQASWTDYFGKENSFTYHSFPGLVASGPDFKFGQALWTDDLIHLFPSLMASGPDLTVRNTPTKLFLDSRFLTEVLYQPQKVDLGRGASTNLYGLILTGFGCFQSLDVGSFPHMKKPSKACFTAIAAGRRVPVPNQVCDGKAGFEQDRNLLNGFPICRS